MSIKTNLAAVAVVAGVTGAVFAGANSVSAQTSGESLVDRISTQFNLNQDEVQAVFDEHKQARQEIRSERASEHLQELVDEGTITEDQRALIESEREAMKAAMEELRPENKGDLSEEEREAIHEEMESLKEAFEQTLADNGIELEDIRPEGNKGQHRKGFGRLR